MQLTRGISIHTEWCRNVSCEEMFNRTNNPATEVFHNALHKRHRAITGSSQRCSINTILFETATDGVWHLAMTWDLSRNSDVDGPEPTDGLILAWDDSHFKYDPGTLEYEVTHEYEIYGDTVIHTNGHELPGGKEIDYIDVSDGPLIGDYNNGIGFRIFDHAQESDGANSWWPLEQTGFAEIDIERQADGPANVQTLFEHTWSIGNVSQFDPIFNTSISKGASSVDISVPFEADSWSEGSTEEIPDNN